MSKLAISGSLSLPIDAVTQKFSFLGRTGSGKSYAATKLCELMLEQNAQVVALDPVGVWYGLRVGADISIPVFGGLHGDIPLEPGGGKIMADLIVSHGISAVLDVSQMIPAEQARFAYDFAAQFFHRKKAKPSPVHLFIEECQEFVPQNIGGGATGFEAKMLGAFERLIKLGRNFGIGASLLSQRPQEVNKKALNQTECLFAFQMTGPQERKAIMSWIHEKGADEDIVEILPKLAVGDCHVWSPQWLKVSETIRIARKASADVSSTPAAGGGAQKQRKLTPVDLEALGAEMAATIERAKAEDPAELRKEIAKLRRDLQVAQKSTPAPAAAAKVKEVPVLTKAERGLIERFCAASEKLVTLGESLDPSGALGAMGNAAKRLLAPNANMQNNLHKAAGASPSPRPPAAARVDLPALPDSDGVTVPQQRILDALGALEALGMVDVDKSNAAVFADQSPTSSGYSNNLGRLRSLGLIHYPQQGRVALTDAGRSWSAGSGAITTLSGLHQAWFSKMAAPKVRILQNLIRLYPESIDKNALADLSAQSPTSSGYSNNLGNLRSLGLIDYPQMGQVVATELLFPPGLG